MREIKFRAWDKQKKVMHFDFQFIKSGDSGNDWIIFQSDKENFNGNFNPYFSQQLKIMQYTGLKDKNGVEIYEGDIVKAHSHKPTNFKIEFIEGGFCATQNGIKYPIDINHFYQSIGCTIEVIGNIYQNPELLEQTKCGY